MPELTGERDVASGMAVDGTALQPAKPRLVSSQSPTFSVIEFGADVLALTRKRLAARAEH